MRNREKVSVIVPVYNIAPYIGKCIESLLNQTFSQMEIILVDDGSTDESGRICDEFKQKDSRIVVIHKENGGLSSARNAGIAAAAGKYIGFVDGDDWVAKEMYERMYNLAESEKAQIVSCKYQEVYEDCDLAAVHGPNTFASLNKRDALKSFFLRQISESVCDKLFLKRMFSDVRFPEGEINEDTCVVVRLLMQSQKVVCLERKLYYYRKRRGSITRSGYSQAFQIVAQHLSQISSWVKRDYPDLDPYMKNFFGSHYYFLLLSILNEPNRNQYRKDYHIYLKKFSKCFFSFIKWGTGEKKDRILGLLLILRLDWLYILYKRITRKD